MVEKYLEKALAIFDGMNKEDLMKWGCGATNPKLTLVLPGYRNNDVRYERSMNGEWSAIYVGRIPTVRRERDIISFGTNISHVRACTALISASMLQKELAAAGQA